MEYLDKQAIQKSLDSLLNLLATSSKGKSRDFTFYWSKKSPEVASAIYQTFTTNESIVLDPFIGSGSALAGLKLFDNKLKFIGIDINELPIQMINMNMNALGEKEIMELERTLTEYIDDHKEIYSYKLFTNEDPYVFHKAQHQRLNGMTIPTYFQFRRGNKKLNLTEESDFQTFIVAKDLYMSKQQAVISKYHHDEDLELGTNSRIAIKKGMKLSEIFAPTTFALLLDYKQIALTNFNFAILLSSCLHLCRLTDKGSQSQFPYWVPKSDAVERNIFILLQSKLEMLKYATAKEVATSDASTKITRANDFKELSLTESASYLLLHHPIQRVSNQLVPDSSVDLVFTDPPYFDQVAYSEYLVIWEFFTGLKTNLQDEIIESNRELHASDRRQYLKLLAEGFTNVTRMLKENCLAIIYFKDSKLKNISDFLLVMEESGLQYLTQMHLLKPTYTYKQNTSQKTTVEGDALYFFVKKSGYPKVPLVEISDKELRRITLSFMDDYLAENGPSTPSKVMDDCVIPQLWDRKLLHLIKQDSFYLDIVNSNYSVDKGTRKLIGRK